jgi:acetoin utilization deacetylase AcuC-like enzyme
MEFLFKFGRDRRRYLRCLFEVKKGYGLNVLDDMELANEVCQGRMLMAQEGGYSTPYVPFCCPAVMEALSGIKTDVVDPYLEFYEGLTGQDLQPHQDAVIRKCEELAAKVPPFIRKI